MTREQLASYIRLHSNEIEVRRMTAVSDYAMLILRHTRGILYEHRHITDEHIFECCEKANTHEEFIELCRPLAIADEQAWRREWNKSPQKGRTRKRFRGW